jgi:hypothetical protein
MIGFSIEEEATGLFSREQKLLVTHPSNSILYCFSGTVQVLDVRLLIKRELGKRTIRIQFAFILYN